jgi:hypothetical protein
MAVTMVTNTVFVNQQLPVTLTLNADLSGYSDIVSLWLKDPEGNEGYATAGGTTAEMTIDTATTGVCSYTISAGTITFTGLWQMKAYIEDLQIWSESVYFYAYEDWDQ